MVLNSTKDKTIQQMYNICIIYKLHEIPGIGT